MDVDLISVQAFPFLSSDEISRLLPAVHPISVQKGGELFHAGDAADGVFFLEKGRLAVLQRTGFNDRTQVIALLEPGAPVGEGGGAGGSLRSATIIAIEDSVLYHLDCNNLVILGDQEPQILMKLLKRLLFVSNLRLQKCSERLAHVL